MSIKDIDFASLLCSKLCHDLLSPVGALNNGIELLAEETDPDMRERCFALLGESARTTAAKLKFFRLAFGAAGGFGEDIPSQEVKSALEGLFAPGGRVQLGWLVGDQTLTKGAAKILLNLAMMAGEALVRGGRLDIGAESHNGATELVVRAEGQRIVIDPDLRTALEGGTPRDMKAARVAPALMVRALVEEAEGELQTHIDDSVLMFGAQISGTQGR